MRIIPKKCDGCMKCVPFCSSDAIRRGEKNVRLMRISALNVMSA
ncbi:MAG: 4Fe-4S binding protein [Deltaproteobacteria bacterium]|nr:4Fe-4S binding protein [Deltaproteobacteria bacterium]